jgi:pimeloyl-ACP methyl ester carboxylesterase
VTAVFVHGNPETAAVWGPLLTELAEMGRPDVVTLSPPGFGAPVPEGFGATSDEYVGWLATELESIGENEETVDLVGHDWGGNHVLRLACARPDLLRSWCTDVAGTFAPDYDWPDASRGWQTPVVGEQLIDAQAAMGVSGRTDLYVSLGMTPEVAAELAGAFDEAMGRCILAVYRSATNPAAQWGDRLPAAAARPGLVLIPTEDTYTGGESRHRWSAEQTGARVAVLEGAGHWWMLQSPRPAAHALVQFWSGLDRD